MSTYTADLGFDRLTIEVDLSQASSPITYEGADGEWVTTPFQCADAGHDEARAMRLVLEYLGRDYYAEPDDDRDDDDIVADLLDGVDIECTSRPCECESCGCTELASTTDDGGNPSCEACADYYCDENGQPVCSRAQDNETCRHCGEAIEWGGIQTGQPGDANWSEGTCSCREWTCTERGGDWVLSEGAELDAEALS